MYNDDASEAPLYLVSNMDGTGKRLVRRPHPPPTTAPLPDDFDAITETRDSTTVYDEAANSALDIDYDAITIAPATPRPSSPFQAQTQTQAPIPIRAPVPLSPHRTGPTSPPRQHHSRAASPSRSLASLNLNLTLSPDTRGSGSGSGSRRGDGPNPGKARSVAGGGDRDRDRATQRRSLGTGNPPPPLPFPQGKGPAKGRGELIEKLVLEDGPERTISFWRETVAKNANGHAAAATAGAGGDGGGGGGGGGDAGEDGDGRGDLDSHLGHRRVSTDSRRRVESLVQGSASVKSKGHRSRESADFTEVSRSPLQPAAAPTRSGTPHANTASQPSTPQKSTQRRAAPSSPSVGGPKASEYSASVSDATSHTKVAPAPVPVPAPAPVSHGNNHPLESVLSSCQPSLVHLLPILEELGVRCTEHMTALVRMREETRDREVKEEALRKGITVVEWAIFIDRLQSL
ncbi:hypothetical protein BC827DRAFT_1262988 [Russula dissimulans]|nr:hypothetical protein BC827DRAFT_1262988 [Russula dissimulans]